MLDAPPERGLGGETFIPSSRSRRRLVFLSRTQTLAKLKETTKDGALPPAFVEIHHAPMALGPQRGGGPAAAPAGGRNPSFLLEEEAAAVRFASFNNEFRFFLVLI